MSREVVEFSHSPPFTIMSDQGCQCLTTMSLEPPNPDADIALMKSVCTEEHCFHAFDALYCALTPGARPISPEFPDDK